MIGHACNCVISNQNQEITTLKLKLDEVLNELSALKNEVADLKKEVSQHLVQDDNNPDSIPTDSIPELDLLEILPGLTCKIVAYLEIDIVI